MDAISEVEKLKATQQLMAMIIPPSTVDVMSNEEDCCFQCQEPGYIAWCCPHIRHYECDKYGHIVMDCWHRILPSGTSATRHKSQKGHHGRSSLRHHHEDRDRQSQSRSQSHFRSHCSLSHHNSHRGCSKSQHRDRCNHHRSSAWQSHSAHSGHSHRPCHDTPHWSHWRSSQHQSSSGYQSQDHSRSHSQPSYRFSRHISCKSDSYPSRARSKPNPTKNMKMKIEDPHTDSHEEGGLPSNDQVTVALITDCSTITVHAGKCCKALVDSGAAILLIRYSTYQPIHSSFKTPIQTTTTKLNTADGTLMMALGITALHLRIVDYKFIHYFIICNRLPGTEMWFGIDIQKKVSLSYACYKEKNCYV